MKKSLTSFPLLLRELHAEKNTDLNPSTVSYGSKKKVWWKCSKGEDHEWQAQVANRTKIKNPSGCPFCSGRVASKKNNLDIYYPNISKEWHKTKNGDSKPEHFTPSSHAIIWWQCKVDSRHVWEETINHRTNMKTGCPYCSNKRVNSTNNLTALFPHIAKEWHPELNGNLKPEQYSRGSGKVAWWICKFGHEWKTRISSRTKKSNPTGCPLCSLQTSKPEVRLYSELKGIFSDAIWRHKIRKLELDIFIPSLNLGIEYDGFYFHKGNIAKDRKKNEELKKIGVKIIRVREYPLRSVDTNDLVTLSKGLDKVDIDRLLNKDVFTDKDNSLLIKDYTKSKDFKFDDIYRKRISRLPYPEVEKSLLTTYPEISGEWDQEKNAPLSPHMVSPGSHFIAWWRCWKGHSYKSRIDQRTRGGGCPICANTVVSSENNFLITHPEIAYEWHKNNSRLPSEFVSGSNYYADWQCRKDKSHQWKTTIRARTRVMKPSGCPYCTGKLPDKKNNLLKKFPEVARDWHYKKNGDLFPQDLTPKSDKKVWWICSEHTPSHEWKTSVKHRTLSKSGCPKCAKIRVNLSNKKTVHQIDHDGKIMRSWTSVSECADSLVLEGYGLPNSIARSVARVCRRERKSWKKMAFKYGIS